MSFNLATILTETALAAPDAPACRFGGTTTSYRELDEQSGRLAAGLQAANLTPGQVVAVQLPNVPQFLTAYFGALKAGLVVLPLNPLLMAPELEYHLGDSAAALLIGSEGMHAEAAKACETTGVPLYLVSTGPGPLPGSARPFSELFGAAPLAEPGGIPRAPDDTAVLVYTSGTTGRPKGAELTHFQLYMNCTIAGGLFGVRSDDVVLAVLPFFHVFGLSSVLNVFVRFGGCLSILPRFQPGAVLDAIEADRCTVIGGVPTMLHALAQLDVAGRDLSALRVAVSGGASLPEDIMRTFEDKYRIEVLEGYGMTETASSCTFNQSGDRKVLSIGKPLWGVRMQVSDREGRTLPPGREHVGEILIRGHNVMKGYLGRPEATAETLRDGWLHSGDLGYVDEDGFYFIVDRAKDLVIRGGYNVYPREIEEVLYAHPAILEAAVIGKPDERLGEEVVAVVALRPGHDVSAGDIIAYTRERLAAYKYPREIRFMAELPKGPTGKILKSALRGGALDAEVLPFPVRWYVLVPGAHPAPGPVGSHVFDCAVNETPNGLEDLAELSHDVLSSTYLNRTSPRARRFAYADRRWIMSRTPGSCDPYSLNPASRMHALAGIRRRLPRPRARRSVRLSAFSPFQLSMAALVPSPPRCAARPPCDSHRCAHRPGARRLLHRRDHVAPSRKPRRRRKESPLLSARKAGGLSGGLSYGQDFRAEGAPIVGRDARGFPPGHLRVSDGERDRALSELSAAYQVGRITADEFDHRSTQALSARTGRELAAVLADLPLDDSPVGAVPAVTATPRRADGYLVSRLTIGASLTAICFGGVAVTNALHPGVGGIAVLTPAAVAVLCVVLVIVLMIRARASKA